MPQITFYDKYGRAIAYCEDGEHIYTFGGAPVAYIHDDSIYSYGGTHLGFFENGWVRDNAGYCVFFTDNASGGPIKPTKGLEPIKAIKSIKPIKSIKQIRPIRPIPRNGWSSLMPDAFFFQ
jgi:hypothetical protein